MKPYVIVFISHKGGSGKSTSVLNLAVAATLDSKVVLVIDLDDGASATDWYRARTNEERLKRVALERLRALAWDASSEEMRRVLDELKAEYAWPLVQPTHHAGIEGQLRLAAEQGIDWVLIDTKGGTEQASMAALEVADLVIMPVAVSAMDLRQSRNTVRLCRREGKQVYALLGDFDASGPEEADARAALMGAQEPVDVLPGGLGHRKAYKRAVIPGLGVQEYEPKGRAAEEVQRLYSDVSRLLERKQVSVQESQRVSTGAAV